MLTNLGPDIIKIVWNQQQIHLFELAICWETNFKDAAIGKEAQYLHLLEAAREKGITEQLYTIQVGSRGFLDAQSLDFFFNLLAPTAE